MSVTYIRYNVVDGKYIAKITKENTDPPPEPRDIFEAIKVLTPAEVDMIIARPRAFRYDNLMPEPLAEGVIIVSNEIFYPTVENFDELYPTLDDCVYIEARFETLPQNAPVKIEINNHEVVLENFDVQPFKLTSSGAGLFTIKLTDARCFAERNSFTITCSELPPA